MRTHNSAVASLTRSSRTSWPMIQKTRTVVRGRMSDKKIENYVKNSPYSRRRKI